MAVAPRVTVLMPVYNGEEYLREAVDSVLNQTFTDFELLIINDGSTDKSVEIIESYSDSSIRLVHNEKNIKLGATLNKGLHLARGEYIARMDCDDISLPSRLEKQVAFMDSNPKIVVCGTWIRTFGGATSSVSRYATDSDNIRCIMLFDSSMAHPSVMMRRECLINNKLLYDEEMKYAQDYDLWVRCAQLFPLKNIDEVLLLYRQHAKQIGKEYSGEQKKTANKIRLRQLKQLEILPTDEEFMIHQRLSYFDYEASKLFVKSAESWLLKLQIANERVRIYPQQAFNRVLGEYWFKVCAAAASLGIWAWKNYRQSPLTSIVGLNLIQKIGYSVKYWIRYRTINKYS